MSIEIARSLSLPKKSFLLLGPRGTGKSTLLKMQIKPKLEVNLLKSVQYLPLQQNPSLLHEWVEPLKPGDWVVIDEVQKIPALMDEIHAIYEEKKINFAITGSSARKLKRGGANLLAGRAIQVHLFPLIHSEIGNRISFNDYIDWGGLPGVVTDPENRRETLATYIEVYLKQELVEEGIIRKLDPFVRFLKIAGIYNSQILNIENIARESHVKRPTVDTYFEILEDTMIGTRLQPLQLNIHTKEVRHPKFYFFDSGVARASAGLIFDEVDSIWRGFALETTIFNELRAYDSYHKKAKNYFYYKVTGGIEIDFLVEIEKKTLSRPRSLLAIEVKSATEWRAQWDKPLLDLIENKKSGIKKAIGVYLGKKTLSHKNIEIFPVERFLEKLNNGDFF